MDESTLRVTDLLDDHVVLDVECLDRIYLNGYVPTLQTSGGVWWFFRKHLGFPIASPALMEKIGTGFRRAVARFAEDNRIDLLSGADRGHPRPTGTRLRSDMPTHHLDLAVLPTEPHHRDPERVRRVIA